MKSIIFSAIFATSALAAPVVSDVETSPAKRHEESFGLRIDKCHECDVSYYGPTVDCSQCTPSGVLDESIMGHEEFQFDFLQCFEVYSELEEGSTIFSDYGLRPSQGSDDLTKCVNVEVGLEDLTPEETAVKLANDPDAVNGGETELYISGTCSVAGRKMTVKSKIEGAIGWSQDKGGFYCTGTQ